MRKLTIIIAALAMGTASLLLPTKALAVTDRRCPSPYTFYVLRGRFRYSAGTTIIAGIASCFVLVRRAGRTRVDHLGAVNRCCRALSNIGAHCISIIRGKDRAGGTRVGRGRAEA